MLSQSGLGDAQTAQVTHPSALVAITGHGIRGDKPEGRVVGTPLRLAVFAIGPLLIVLGLGLLQSIIAPPHVELDRHSPEVWVVVITLVSGVLLVLRAWTRPVRAA